MGVRLVKIKKGKQERSIFERDVEKWEKEGWEREIKTTKKK